MTQTFAFVSRLLATARDYESQGHRANVRRANSHKLALEFAGATLVTCLYITIYYLVLGVRGVIRHAVELREAKEDGGDQSRINARARTVVNALDATYASFRMHMFPFTALLWVNAITVNEKGAVASGVFFIALELIAAFLRVAASEWRSLPYLLPTLSASSGATDAAWARGGAGGGGGGTSPQAKGSVRVVALIQALIVAYLLGSCTVASVMTN